MEPEYPQYRNKLPYQEKTLPSQFTRYHESLEQCVLISFDQPKHSNGSVVMHSICGSRARYLEFSPQITFPRVTSLRRGATYWAKLAHIKQEEAIRALPLETCPQGETGIPSPPPKPPLPKSHPFALGYAGPPILIFALPLSAGTNSRVLLFLPIYPHRVYIYSAARSLTLNPSSLAIPK